MSRKPHYSLETEVEEADAAARDLPEQIARVREHVRRAKADLSGEGQFADGSKP